MATCRELHEYTSGRDKAAGGPRLAAVPLLSCLFVSYFLNELHDDAPMEEDAWDRLIVFVVS